MAEISAAVVKELRERTGAGMMDCKRALSEMNGDLDKAIEFLREKGLAAAAKKAGRVAAEGLVSSLIRVDKKAGVLVEVNCETDFVAKNPDFQQFVNDVSQAVLDHAPADLEGLAGLTISSGKTVSETLTGLIATIGENMAVRRFARFELTENGAVDSYIHMGGKIGVLVEIGVSKAATAGDPDFAAFVKDMAMQVAAARPEYVKRDEVPASVLEQEKAIYKAQAMNEGKPEAIAEKIMVGRLDKFYKEVCLVEQLFIKDNDKTITKLIQELNAKLGEDIVIKRFARFEKGEGIEKKKDDFATEVMSQIKG
ncbi:translation elongation factor Ts (EF-Ts) [Hydrogenispora ethanolica]|jgi:elongation factor Ts|uniref:Elongation factor Ts n=1 Tax=Hydrogenispora ethanolica TaxID=1082276 RepID=A0A4R1RSG7_HYDET|nr:translation elongation factor Ts [Hydrogenispora ethanolica]TCL69421.1 translation elongation factor Ts (EF-Ts) [Hydrogenispora ethanolica]